MDPEMQSVVHDDGPKTTGPVKDNASVGFSVPTQSPSSRDPTTPVRTNDINGSSPNNADKCPDSSTRKFKIPIDFEGLIVKSQLDHLKTHWKQLQL